MHIAAHVLGALPLVHVQARRGGEQHVRPQQVEPGKGAVPLADELAFHRAVFLFQRRIVRRGRHIGQRLAAPLEFVADRLKQVPVALAVREDHIREAVLPLLFFLFPAAEHEAELHQGVAEQIDAGAQHADQDGEQHAARAGVDIQAYDKALHISAPPDWPSSRPYRCRRARRTRSPAGRRCRCCTPGGARSRTGSAARRFWPRS